MLALFLLGITANAQQTESRTVSGFTKVTVSDGVELIYTQNDNITLKAEGTTNEGLNHLVTKVKNGELIIYQMDKMNQAAGENTKVYLTANDISCFVASTKATITATSPIFTENMRIDLNSGAAFNATVNANSKITLNAGTATVFNIKVITASLDGNFRSDSRINLCGVATNTIINTSGTAFCLSKNLLTDNAIVDAQDNSKVLIHAKEKISINVESSGKVTYTGSPEHTKWNDNAYASISNKKSNQKTVTLNYQNNKPSSKKCFNQEKSK